MSAVDPQVAIAAAAVAAAAQTNSVWNTIILGTIGFLSTIVSSVTVYLIAKLRVDATATKVASQATALSIEKVHVAVNSERTAMTNKIDLLQQHVLDLSKELATAIQRADDLSEKLIKAEKLPVRERKI